MSVTTGNALSEDGGNKGQVSILVEVDAKVMSRAQDRSACMWIVVLHVEGLAREAGAADVTVRHHCTLSLAKSSSTLTRAP
jgi:hypothetical protein